LVRKHLADLLSKEFTSKNRGQLPEIDEKMRRLDAAMPRQISVNQPTEVWVQICLPDSDGFRNDLPQYTKEGDIINRGDVKDSEVPVQFPVDPDTGEPLPVLLSIRIEADDFAIDEHEQTIRLSPDSDSGRLIFGLTPHTVRDRSPVKIRVRTQQLDGKILSHGSVSLRVDIKPTGIKLAANIMWSLVILPFTAAISWGQPKQVSETQLVESASDPSSQVQLEAIETEIETQLSQHSFDAAYELIDTMPVTDAVSAAFQQTLRARTDATLQDFMNQIQHTVERLVADGKFVEAMQLLEQIPTQRLQDWQTTYVWKIEQDHPVISLKLLEPIPYLIEDDAIEEAEAHLYRAKSAWDSGSLAIRLVPRIPDAHIIQTNWQRRIEDVEPDFNLKHAKALLCLLVAQRDFDTAHRLVESITLPGTQINPARLHQLVDAAQHRNDPGKWFVGQSKTFIW
jgi:hypothetical protein